MTKFEPTRILAGIGLLAGLFIFGFTNREALPAEDSKPKSSKTASLPTAM